MAANFLEVYQFRNIGMRKDMVAPPGAAEDEAKADCQIDHIRKSDIPIIALSKFSKQFSPIHQVSVDMHRLLFDQGVAEGDFFTLLLIG